MDEHVTRKVCVMEILREINAWVIITSTLILLFPLARIQQGVDLDLIRFLHKAKLLYGNLKQWINKFREFHGSRARINKI